MGKRGKWRLNQRAVNAKNKQRFEENQASVILGVWNLYIISLMCQLSTHTHTKKKLKIKNKNQTNLVGPKCINV